MYWFNTETGEVQYATSPPWSIDVRMGPYETAALAHNAYLVAAARNAAADLVQAQEAAEKQTADAAAAKWSAQDTWNEPDSWDEKTREWAAADAEWQEN
ncbi:MAG: hypothetical protein Q4E03_03780 [Trueperella sp.]|nr:hypothetical protein [Trueperella sp.]